MEHSCVTDKRVFQVIVAEDCEVLRASSSAYHVLALTHFYPTHQAGLVTGIRDLLRTHTTFCPLSLSPLCVHYTLRLPCCCGCRHRCCRFSSLPKHHTCFVPDRVSIFCSFALFPFHSRIISPLRQALMSSTLARQATCRRQYLPSLEPAQLPFTRSPPSSAQLRPDPPS